MSVVTRHLRSCYSLEAELTFVVLVLLAWHAIRIPLEGDVATSLAHAQDVLRLERALSLDVESWIVDLLSASSVQTALAWLYTNIHLPVLFGFVATVRLLAPDRYPAIRTTFVVSFVPAVFVIGLYPLAPPHWLPEYGFGGPPSQDELAGTTGALFHNTTAAATSQHFGFALFVAAVSIWLFPRSRAAWGTVAYPALALVVIVGTGNHYVVDCIVGTLTFVLGAFAARLLHRRRAAAVAPAPTTAIASIALGYALVVWGFVSLHLTDPTSWDNLFPGAVALAAGAAAILVPRLTAKEPLTETS